MFIVSCMKSGMICVEGFVSPPQVGSKVGFDSVPARYVAMPLLVLQAVLAARDLILQHLFRALNIWRITSTVFSPLLLPQTSAQVTATLTQFA